MEPDLAKDILIKYFKSFHENEFSALIQPENDPLFARNPFLARGQDWKEKRSEISPAFTGNRTKALYPLAENVCRKLTKYIKENLNQPIETKELCAQFTTEAVASCIFGIDANCLSNDQSELREKAKELFKISTITIIKIMIVTAFPEVKNLLRIQLIGDKTNDYFMNLLAQSIDHRTKNSLGREDYLDYIIALQKKKAFSISDIAGHSITFFSDGLETSSVNISYTLYEVLNEVDSDQFNKFESFSSPEILVCRRNCERKYLRSKK